MSDRDANSPQTSMDLDTSPGNVEDHATDEEEVLDSTQGSTGPSLTLNIEGSQIHIEYDAKLKQPSHEQLFYQCIQVKPEVLVELEIKLAEEIAKVKARIQESIEVPPTKVDLSSTSRWLHWFRGSTDDFNTIRDRFQEVQYLGFSHEIVKYMLRELNIGERVCENRGEGRREHVVDRCKHIFDPDAVYHFSTYPAPRWLKRMVQRERYVNHWPNVGPWELWTCDLWEGTDVL